MRFNKVCIVCNFSPILAPQWVLDLCIKRFSNNTQLFISSKGNCYFHLMVSPITKYKYAILTCPIFIGGLICKKQGCWICWQILENIQMESSTQITMLKAQFYWNKFNICVWFFTAAATPGPAFITWSWPSSASYSTSFRIATTSHPTHWQQCWPSSLVECPWGTVPPPH